MQMHVPINNLGYNGDETKNGYKRGRQITTAPSSTQTNGKC
jgi:hypothetical protein